MKKLIVIGSLLTLLTISFLVLANNQGSADYDIKANPNCENC